MKNLPLIRLLLAACCLPGTASALPPAPRSAAWEIMDLPAENGALCRCIVVETIPGVLYPLRDPFLESRGTRRADNLQRTGGALRMPGAGHEQLRHDHRHRHGHRPPRSGFRRRRRHDDRGTRARRRRLARARPGHPSAPRPLRPARHPPPADILTADILTAIPLPEWQWTNPQAEIPRDSLIDDTGRFFATTVHKKADTPVDWSAETDAEGDLPLPLRWRTSVSLSAPVALKAMKRRTLKIHVWHVTLPQGGGIARPMEIFTEEQIEPFLDDIFLPQVNLSFEEWIRSKFELLDSLEGAPLPEQMEKLSLYLVDLGHKARFPQLGDEERKLLHAIQERLVSIPGHAEYLGENIRKWKKRALEDPRFYYDYTRKAGKAFNTLRYLPSSESVRVAASFLDDDYTRYDFKGPVMRRDHPPKPGTRQPSASGRLPAQSPGSEQSGGAGSAAPSRALRYALWSAALLLALSLAWFAFSKNRSRR